MTRRPKSRNVRSLAKSRRREGDGETDTSAGVVKSLEEPVKQWALEAHALLESGQFDPVKAGRLKMEMDLMMLAIQQTKAAEERAKPVEEKEFFDWLETNVPESSGTTGRPKWIESEKVMSKDKALLYNFDQKLNHNTAASAGKKHGASKKTYGDLADESGDQDIETVKRRVMRARKRRKAMQEAIQGILGIVALSKTDGDKVIPPKEYEKRREKLLKAFRSVLRTK